MAEVPRGDIEFVPRVCLFFHTCPGADAEGQVQRVGYHRRVAEESAQPLEQQLEEIRTQLAWVRDYL